jgi:RNA-binding protein
VNPETEGTPPEPAAAALPGALVRHLKAKAQRLEAILKIGHAGLTPAFIAAVDHELSAHELIKVKLSAQKEQKRELAQQLAAATRSHVVFIIGHVALLYRRGETKDGGESLEKRKPAARNPEARSG